VRIARLAPLVVAALVFCLPARAVTVQDRPSSEHRLLHRMNSVRAQHGLRPLKLARTLRQAATRHTDSMARHGYFAHELLESGVWRAFGTWIHWYWPGANHRSWRAGENLAWAAPRLGARRTVRMWLRSPVHRANLLGSGWRRIGISVVYIRQPVGNFRGRTATIVAADFGSAR
jgi:uncharacterized protein YkwD